MEVRPGYKQTDVGVIPEDWSVIPLGDCARLRTGPFGSALHKSDYTADGVPVVNPMHIGPDGLEPTRAMTVTEHAANALADFRLRPGDIVLGRRGDMGRCALVQAEHAGWLCGTGSMIVRCGTTADAAFMRRVLSSPRAIAALEEGSVGTTMVNLNQGSLSRLLVQCPPRLEQVAIAGALGDVDALLAGVDRLIAKRRDLKQAAMQQLLTGQTRLPGFHDEWARRTLGELVLDGPRNGYSAEGGEGARGTLTLRLTATTSGRLILNADTVKCLGETIELGSDLFLRPGDLLVQRSNTSDLVGTAALFDGPPDTYIYPDLMMRLRFRDEITAQWLWRCINSLEGRRFFLAVAAGSTGSMPKISGETLRSMTVPFPSLTERAAITQVLSDIDAELAALEARRDKTRALKQAMMRELLTGRIRLV